MSVDIYHSRRTNFKECYYYVRDTNINDLSRYVLEKKPVGLFYARLFTPNTRQNQDVANTFRFSENTLTLFTSDDIEDLVENNIVLYNGKPYVVLNVQRKECVRESQYMNEHYCETYISLKR